MSNKERNARLVAALARPGIVVVPGSADGLGARLVELAGFDAVYMSGFATAGSMGKPDVGVLSMSEVLERATQIADVVNIPLICDTDNGYGNAVNVVRTVRAFERAGVSAIQLEDQASPKKCGSAAGKEIIPVSEMVGKIKAVVDTRQDRNFLLIARTDAMAVEGLDSAIARAVAYRDAGADLLMFHGPKSEEHLARIVRETNHPNVWLNSESLTMPIIPTARLEQLGARMAIFPISITLRAAKAAMEVLQEIRQTGDTRHVMDRMVPFGEFNAIVGMKDVMAIEEAYKG